MKCLVLVSNGIAMKFSIRLFQLVYWLHPLFSVDVYVVMITKPTCAMRYIEPETYYSISQQVVHCGVAI